ncbi:unnamed protein product [Polarella glacialis]|uniref:alpha-1,3-mannosyl-glycoprotein 2-beta-N-acetylglucosaminyltransferase n=1 Tax=Polarella glacialis TaxID=89957 RepID=A0A813HE32_POLGL|nr:unnamed protein product [Polarella glacialis]
MIQNSTWSHLRQVWPRFPSTGWDHWLRHGSGLRPRECIVPEVSRTHHFDTSGTNVKAGSELAKKLERMATSRLPPKQLGDLSYLLHDDYEAKLMELARGAKLISGSQLGGLKGNEVYLLPYIRSEYSTLAKQLQISVAQPRTAHRGVIITRHPTSLALIILADRMNSQATVLPESERRHPDPGQRVQKAQAGESCDKLCQRLGMRCMDAELEYVNNCAAMLREFPCEEGCGHQVGKEIPCYVHDPSRDTAKQCLVTDDAVPSCAASHPATMRLCACVP